MKKSQNSISDNLSSFNPPQEQIYESEQPFEMEELELEFSNESQNNNAKIDSATQKIKTEDDPMKVNRKLTVVDFYEEEREFKVEKLADYDYSKICQDAKSSKLKYRVMKIKGFGIPGVVYTEKGLPSVDVNALKKLVDGPIQKHFK